MADIHFDVGDMDRLLAGLSATSDRVERDAPDIVQRAGSRYQSRAKFFAPVDTGRLRESITVEPGGGLAVTVTAHQGYAGFQEYGTSRMSPQPFMGPAERSVTPEVVDEFGALGRRIL